MSEDDNGKSRRMDDLNAARPSGYVIKPLEITVDEARAMIDSVFRNYGLDPTQSIIAGGWRTLTLGSARGFAGVIEWQDGDPYLVVFAPLIELPAEVQISDFYRALLELNHAETLSARFSLSNDTLFVSLVRPIRGLDVDEVDEALRAVMVTADHAETWLTSTINQFLGRATLPASELPRIRMTPDEALKIGALLATFDPHERALIRDLLEKWVKAGYPVDASQGGVGLKIPFGPRQYTLAAIRVGVRTPSPLVILGWESLRRLKAIPAEAIDRFQSEVATIAAVKTTESAAHLEITPEFTADRVQKLVKALDRLAKSVQHDQVQPAKPVTPPNIEATLSACDPHTRRVFSRLIQGWADGGGIVQCQSPGRIYLKLQTGEHEFGKYGKQSHKFNLIVLAAPKGKRGPSIDVAWNMARGDYAYLDTIPEQVFAFEELVSGLPGFEQKGTITRLLVSELFEDQHGEALLKPMLGVKEAELRARGK
jgi:hypothetical protein